MSCPVCGNDPADGGLCHECTADWLRRLEWLRRIGMPVLREVAYRRVRFREHGHAPASTPPSPLDETAAQTYADVERDLRAMAGIIGAGTPLGWDRTGRRVSTRDAQHVLPELERRIDDLALTPDAADLYQATVTDCERVDALTHRREERRLVGVCPECLRTTDGDGEPVRTPILAEPGRRWAVCRECGAFLDLREVRARYLESAGGLHITRTQSDAARWVRENAGVHVTGRDLKNWRSRGLIHPRHIEGAYWEWDIRELIECTVRMRGHG